MSSACRQLELRRLAACSARLTRSSAANLNLVHFPIARAGLGRDVIALFNHALELVDHLAWNALPQQASCVHLGSSLAFALFTHRSKRLCEVATMLGGL